MAMTTTKTRLRSRSSVEHIFELVEDLDDTQLQDLLHDLNSTGEHIQVSKGVEFFEEQRRRQPQAKNALRPTPSFINSPHEPVDWPRQKPRPVSGSHWRQSMRIVSTPYGNLGRNQTEPISPPLTASPPCSPPLSPPQSINRHAVSPKRTVTEPIMPSARGVSQSYTIESIPLVRPVSPPRDVVQRTTPPPSELESFNFALESASESQNKSQEDDQVQEQEQPVSPRQPTLVEPPQPDPRRINPMPVSLEAMDTFDAPRPRTATGDAAGGSFKPRSFRRISRPTFLSPVNVPAPDDLARKLSQYLFEGPVSPPPVVRPTPSRSSNASARPLEEMLKEPFSPRAQNRDAEVSGIFEVLTVG